MNTGLVDAFEVPQSAIHLIRLLARPATDEAIQRGAHGVDGALIVRKTGSTAKEAQHRLIQRYSLLPRQSASASSASSPRTVSCCPSSDDSSRESS